MKKMTKVLAILLAVTVCTTTLNPSAYAAEAQEAISTEQLEKAEAGDAETSEQTELEEKSADARAKALEQTGNIEGTMQEQTGLVEETAAAEQYENAKETAADVTVHENTEGRVEFQKENYKVNFTLTGQWDGGYNVSVKLENTGNTVIHDWYLGYDAGMDIESLWNAEIYKSEAGQCVIKNAGWNQDITAGASVDFGFTGKGSFPGFPADCEIIGENTETDEQDFSVEYRLESDWGSGFTGNITVKNNTDRVLEDWVLEFDFERSITGIWNAAVESREGQHYIIRNAGFNSNIAAGQNVSFGFTGQDGVKENEPYNCSLSAYDAASIGSKTVSFDLNYDAAEGAPEKQSVKNGAFAAEPEEPVRGDYYFIGWYTDQEFSQYFDFAGTPITENITLYARWFHLNDNTDTDEDGLFDSLEELFGTDKENPDTDGDGLSDYIEIDLLGLDPVKADTDENGVNDGDEDNDADGLTNVEEMEKGTNPMLSDTDADGLNDAEELNRYGTNPLQRDTDGDGVTDGKEIELGTDPLTAEDAFYVSASGKDGGKVKASVALELEGTQVETLCVEEVKNDTLFPEEIPGYIGEAYNFQVDGSFDTAEISFAFDETLLNNADFAPTIYYFNEEEQQLEELPTTVKGNVASAQVEHFSTYILINRKVYQESFSWMDVWDTNSYSGVEVALVIDDSGSMYSNDRTNNRLEVAKSLIDHLPEKSKAGVVKFENSTTLLTSSLTADKEKAKSFLTSAYFRSSGGTYMYNAINKAFSLFGSTDKNILKMMVVLSDGDTFDAGLHNSTVKAANDNKVKIYTVGFGSSTSYFNSYLKPLANNTAGTFYLASKADELDDIYKDINTKIDIETDSDGDGIPDYYEDHMVIFNGVQLKLDKNNPDTDGDGLKDGEEIIELNYKYNADKTKVIVTGKMKSNPASRDTDGDGLYDNEARQANGKTVAPIDPEPLKVNGPAGLWDAHVKQQEQGVNPTQYSEDPGLSISVDQGIADMIVDLALKLRNTVNANGDDIRKVALIIKKYCQGEDLNKAGAYLLNFVYDADRMAYHSKPDTWQRSFGYNEFYDEVFKIASNMNHRAVDFSVGDKQYVLWMWKGDYWNLNSGAEIGLYENPRIVDGVNHYDAINFELPMTLSLYNYQSGSKIQNVFSWSPEVNQWWITGFNPKFTNPNPNVMVSMGCIDFCGHENLLNGLKSAINKVDNKDMRDYFIFEQNKKVWIMWYEGVAL